MLSINELKLKSDIIKLKNQKNYFALERTIHWLGGVNYSNLNEMVVGIKELILEDCSLPINLVVTSPGGVTGIAMSFYDSMRIIYRPILRTIGSGDVDSSGLIIFLTGTERFITSNTTILLHLAGRTMEGDKRFSTMEMDSMLKEDKIKDYQYAKIVSEKTDGRLTIDDVLMMMTKETILTAEDAKNFGLAHEII